MFTHISHILLETCLRIFFISIHTFSKVFMFTNTHILQFFHCSSQQQLSIDGIDSVARQFHLVSLKQGFYSIQLDWLVEWLWYLKVPLNGYSQTGCSPTLQYGCRCVGPLSYLSFLSMFYYEGLSNGQKGMFMDAILRILLTNLCLFNVHSSNKQ